MCGIVGFLGKRDEQGLRQMVKSLHHRGPDGNGIFISSQTYNGNHLHFGHTRLAIVDIAGGAQPLIDEQTGTVIAYNGEIYNHQEIREKLSALGHIFHTSHSDTETALRAYLEWGTDCFAMFNGMFAMAIYDVKKCRVILARDRFGEKPLFYCKNEKGLAFASEIKALFHFEGFNSSFDYDNIQRFFAWGYMPAQRTVYNDCYSLSPGSYLCFQLDSQKITHQKYWTFNLHPNNSLGQKDENNLVEELRHLLIEAVRRRLLGDVPLGLFLSGGIDSGSILSAMAKILPPEQIHAFTIGFTEASFDESTKAAMMAKNFGIKHRVSTITMDTMREEIYDVLAKMSEPLGDASILPTQELCRFTRKYVTVALSGDGGDELFAGYDPLVALKPAAYYDKCVPVGLHHFIQKLMNNLPSSNKNMSLDFKIKRTLRALKRSEAFRVPLWMSPLSPEEIAEIFANPLPEEALYADAINLWEKNKHLNTLDKALEFFTHFYLSNDILVKVDRAAMMHSLESRAVFLDNDVVDFCQKLPNHFKMRGTTRKYILKKALQGWLPEEILKLPKKGFGIPLNKWIGGLSDSIKTLPNANTLKIEKMKQAFKAGKGDQRLFLWSALAFENMDMQKPLSEHQNNIY